MKTSRFIIATMAVASFVFASCQKETDPVKENSEKSVKFVAQSIETRTAFGEKNGSSYPTLWTTNDSNVKVSLNYKTPKDAAVTPSADFKSATFEATIEDDGTGSYTFYSVSPASAYLSASEQYKSLSVTIPTVQTPTASSVDEAAQILVAKSSTFDTWPSEVAFNYSHMTAYGKMSLTNLNLGSATITSIALTAAENWAGRWYYYFADGRVEANSASATITLNTTSDEDIWFACAPVDLGGKKITVTVNTTAGPFEKEITWPTGKAFTSGKVFKFAVDMAGITLSGTKTYTKVTSKDDITVDSELIIVADAANYAMSTTQNTNNRAQAGITKTGNTIDNPGADVQVFKAKAGNKAQTIAFSTGSGYIYAASSSDNRLKTQISLDENASFSLEIADGKATLVAQGSFTRNTLQYNSGSKLFACYSSASQGAVSIYKLNGSGTSESIFASIPVTGVTLDETASVTVGGTKTLTYSVLPANAGNQNVSWSSDNTAVATVDATGKVTGVAAGTATITVTTEDGAKTASCTVTVKEATSGGYSLVTDASTLKSGDVIVLGCAAKGTAAAAFGTSKFFNSVSATISDDVLTSKEAIEITLGGSADAWTLTTSEGQITTSAAKTLLIDTGTQKTWTITISSDGSATITAGDKGRILYNVNSPRFLNYTSATSVTMLLPEIYKKNN